MNRQIPLGFGRLLLPVVLLLLLATLLRFHLLDAQSFWNDEGNSARLSERAISLIIEGTASDIHPPLYYLILRGWRELVGETEFGLRAFSAFAGVVTVALAIALARLGRENSLAVASIAGLLAAASPVLVYYSQETRMYSFLALLAAASTWVLWQWLKTVNWDRTMWPWGNLPLALAYLILIVAGLYTHYFFPAVIVAQNLVFLVFLLFPAAISERTVDINDPIGDHGRIGRLVVIWAGLMGTAVILYLPWLPIFWRQTGGRESLRLGLATFSADAGAWLGLGSTVKTGDYTWSLLAGGALVLLGVLAGRRRALVPLILASVPISLAYLAGVTDPAFFKFLLVVVPFLCVLGGMTWMVKSRWQLLLAAALTAAYLLGAVQSLGNMYFDSTYARADYREISNHIAAEEVANAGIILNAPNQWEVFTYYHKDGVPVYPLPHSQPGLALLQAELTDIAAAHEKLYVLYWGQQQRDPEGVIEEWLDANTYKTAEEWVGDVRFVTYDIPDVEESVDQPLGAEFETPNGNSIFLQSYHLAPTSPQSGDVLQLGLNWEAYGSMSEVYKVFVHLVDADGNLIAQSDSFPGGVKRPTTDWVEGEIFVDKHGLELPAHLPSGTYRLLVGVYDSLNPALRLTVVGEERDSLVVEELVIP